MQARHEPREEFVERLEGVVIAEARRRTRPLSPSRWIPASPMRMAVAIVAIVFVSMAIGGAVVAAAYRSQTNERRDLVASTYERRLGLAQQRLSIAVERLNGTKRRVAVGVATNRELVDDQLNVIEAEAEVMTTQLQLEEVRLTAQDALSTISAPLVRGRDFVSERWQAELTVPRYALDMEQARLRDTQRRVQIGVANPSEVEVSRVRVAELEAALQAYQRKLDIRKRFLNKEIDATQADLRGLEAEAEMRYQTLEQQVDLAKAEVERASARVKKGIADNIEVTQANVKLLVLQSELVKVELDLALIRRRLKGALES